MFVETGKQAHKLVLYIFTSLFRNAIIIDPILWSASNHCCVSANLCLLLEFDNWGTGNHEHRGVTAKVGWTPQGGL